MNPLNPERPPPSEHDAVTGEQLLLAHLRCQDLTGAQLVEEWATIEADCAYVGAYVSRAIRHRYVESSTTRSRRPTTGASRPPTTRRNNSLRNYES